MIGPRARAGTVVLFFFALGVLVGTALERHRAPAPLAAMSRAEEHEAAMAELREALQLDDQQVAQIEAILAARQEVVQQMWEHFRPEVHRAMQGVHTEIAELLRPHQREGFHDWLKRRHEQGQTPPSLLPAER